MINVTKSSMPDFDEYCNEIKDMWDTHWLTNMGIKHKALQSELEKKLNIKHVTLYTNGHLALEGIWELYNFPKGSEVITTPFTFASTTHAIVRKGLIPVFCDVKMDDYTIDPSKIESLITDKTVAICPVHVYGNLCDIDAIDKTAKKHNLKVNITTTANNLFILIPPNKNTYNKTQRQPYSYLEFFLPIV